MEKKTIFLIVLVTVLISVTLACDLGFGGGESQATLDAMSTAIIQTATAAAVEDGGEGNTAVQTAQAEATQQAMSIAITQTAIANEQGAAAAAQSEAAGPIMAELPQYGVDRENGQFGWAHEPFTLEIDGYQQNDFRNDYIHISAADFVLVADITWETQYGTSGCGFMFRSDGDKNKPNQYMVIISRAGNGHAVFTAIVDGEPANFKDFYAREEDRSFGFHNGDTNRLAVVARGNIIEIYTNGALVGTVDTTQPPKQPTMPPKPTLPLNADDNALAQFNQEMEEYEAMIAQIQNNFGAASMNFDEKDAVFDKGFLGMMVVNESGKTRCDYSDAYLWLINSEAGQ